MADDDKIVNVPMSAKRELTPEEHFWLGQIYDCLYSGNCDLLSNINATVTNIWNQFKQTDESIITETIVTKDVNATSNLTIDYSIDVPTKENYEFLPIRIFYWFLDENNETCHNQAKESDDAENPYCNPLVASTIGQVNTELNFTVELKPQLPAGEYNIVRRIDIDPPVNGQPTWINYGHEVIGRLTVLEDSDEMLVSLFKTGDSSLVDTSTSEDTKVEEKEDRLRIKRLEQEKKKKRK